MMKWMLSILLLLFMVGCIETLDPNTGETRLQLDPNVPAIVEPVVETVGSLAPLFGPVGGIIGGIAVGALGAWRKVKPRFVAAQTKADHYYATAAATVEAIEEFKRLEPTHWDRMRMALEDSLKKQGIDPRIIENVIRGLRGMQPKA